MSSAVIKIYPNTGNIIVTSQSTPLFKPYPVPIRTYFYKADWFPEVIYNQNKTIKPLKDSCHIHLPK